MKARDVKGRTETMVNGNQKVTLNVTGKILRFVSCRARALTGELKLSTGSVLHRLDNKTRLT